MVSVQVPLPLMPSVLIVPSKESVSDTVEP